MRNLIKLQLRSCQIGSNDFPKLRNTTVKLVKFHTEVSSVQFHTTAKEGRHGKALSRQLVFMKSSLMSADVSFRLRQETSFLCFESVLGTGLIQTRQQDVT